MLILGDPGQGKTTFVQKFAFDWAMAQKDKQSNSATFYRFPAKY